MTLNFVSGNRLTLLHGNEQYFPALLSAIALARAEIHLETYIFANDTTGRRIAEALRDAAQRGVRVNLTVDGFGARNFALDFQPALEAAGVRCLRYRPEIGTFHLRRHRLRRMHRKLSVIDAQVAFVGGINIADDHRNDWGHPDLDYAIRVEGPLVSDVLAGARRMWEIVAWANFKRRLRNLPAPPAAPRPVGTQNAAFVVRDNIRHRNAILHAYIAAIQAAQTEIIIANAYFFPGVRFARALYAAARRGVRITILLQGKTDHPLLRYATQALYNAAVEAGIRVFEYEHSLMHAKVAVIDGQWATIGSSNIDPFSLLLAKEANVVVSDPTLAGELHASLHDALRNGAKEISPATLSCAPWSARLLRWLSYCAVRALLGLAGYSRRHWHAGDEPPKAL
jgi:cardiolipin synthase